jgi:hypothetical protein
MGNILKWQDDTSKVAFSNGLTGMGHEHWRESVQVKDERGAEDRLGLPNLGTVSRKLYRLRDI